jgi:hypothetical protein
MTGDRGPRPPLGRLILLLPGGAALIAGIAGGLALLGVRPAPGHLADRHGWLMTLGFLGTLIALERAVALRRWWAFAAPAAMGAGALLLLVGSGPALILSAAGAATMTVVLLALWGRTRDDAVLVQVLGAAFATAAALLGARGLPLSRVSLLLAGFLVATIAAERLELAHIGLPRGAGSVVLSLTGALGIGAIAALLWPDAGYALAGLATLALAAWLVRHDVARRTVRLTGQARFAAACMLAGFVWLAVAGVIWLLGAPSGAAYDAATHAVFAGFAISMVLAHASIILPAVLRRPLPYSPAMWVPALALHAGLVVRVWLGDGLGLPGTQVAGSTVMAAALLAFVGTALEVAVRDGRTTSAPTRPLSPAPDDPKAG